MKLETGDWLIVLFGLAVLPLLAFAFGYGVIGAVIFVAALLWSISRAT